MENTTNHTGNSTTMNTASGSIPIFQTIITIVLAAIMFGMGCAVDHMKLKANFYRPVGLTIGLFCQIILMPVLTYTIIKISPLTPVQSLGLAVIGFSPGGSISNAVTYIVKGDISLSVAMTTCSNTLALATFPMWIAIYTTIENVADELKISYMSLAVTLLSIALPISAGILFRWKYPKQASLVPKVASLIALVVLIITLVSMFIVVDIPFAFSANTVLPAGILPLLGMGVAYLISCIPALNLPPSARKAIAIETGIQNKGIPNAALLLTFGHRFEIFSHAITIPLIYTISQAASIIVMVVAYRIWLCKTKCIAKEEEVEEKNNTIAVEKIPLRRFSNGKDFKKALDEEPA